MSLLRLQMLPMIKEKKQWSLEQCHSKNMDLDQQPVGAEGNALGAVAVVQLQVKVDSTGVEQDIPLYVLDSTKPIWNGELTNCGVILGTNALSSLGFQISLPDGSTLEPEGTTRTVDTGTSVDTIEKAENTSFVAEQQADTPKKPATEETNLTAIHPGDKQRAAAHPEGASPAVRLVSDLHLGPRQTKLTCVRIKGTPPYTVKLGVLSPGTNLAKVHCDFVEELWDGEESLKVPITNWTIEPIVIAKDQIVGEIEEVSLVDRDDSVWEEEPELVARISQSANNHLAERRKQLQEQLIVGKDCSLEERNTLLQASGIRFVGSGTRGDRFS